MTRIKKLMARIKQLMTKIKELMGRIVEAMRASGRYRGTGFAADDTMEMVLEDVEKLNEAVRNAPGE